MTFAAIIFFASCVGITALLALKYWEMRHDRVFVPRLREKADARAEQFKELLAAARIDLAKVPPEGLRMARILIHEAALGFAALAGFAQREAHRLADLVSHKHRFERRETQSEFLKKVAEHKNGGEQAQTEVAPEHDPRG